jgi:hypothetical protein
VPSHNKSKELLLSVKKEIVTEIEINAPPSRVWQILTDFEKYPTWNPFIKKVSGIAARNEKLEVHMPDPRGGTMVYTPDVLAAERDRELRQSEKFTGSMVESLEGWLDTAVKQNFEDMNRALKQKAENP